MSKFTLVISEEAVEDIVSAFAFYEDRQIGLGERFLQELDIKFQIIIDQPLLFAVFADQYRQVQMRSFPFLIVYEYYGSEVIIYAVFHARQHPDKN